MLDTRFPRLPGDIGNPASFAFETRYRRVPAATVSSVVTPDAMAPDVASAAFAEDVGEVGHRRHVVG